MKLDPKCKKRDADLLSRLSELLIKKESNQIKIVILDDK